MVIKDTQDPSDNILADAKKIFEVLQPDPDYQATPSQTRDEVVMGEAIQRATQSYRNNLALSMGMSKQLAKFMDFMKADEQYKASDYPDVLGAAVRGIFGRLNIKPSAVQGFIESLGDLGGRKWGHTRGTQEAKDAKRMQIMDFLLNQGISEEDILDKWERKGPQKDKKPDKKEVEEQPKETETETPKAGPSAAATPQDKEEEIGSAVKIPTRYDQMDEMISDELAKLEQKSGGRKARKAFGRADNPKLALKRLMQRYVDPAMLQSGGWVVDALVDGSKDIQTLAFINESMPEEIGAYMPINQLNALIKALDAVAVQEKFFQDPEGAMKKRRTRKSLQETVQTEAEALRILGGQSRDLETDDSLGTEFIPDFYQAINDIILQADPNLFDPASQGEVPFENIYEALANRRIKMANDILQFIDDSIDLPLGEDNRPLWRELLEQSPNVAHNQSVHRYGEKAEQYEFSASLSRRDEYRVYKAVYLNIFGKNHIPIDGDGSQYLMQKLQRNGPKGWWRGLFDANSPMEATAENQRTDLYEAITNMPNSHQEALWTAFAENPTDYNTPDKLYNLKKSIEAQAHVGNSAKRDGRY